MDSHHIRDHSTTSTMRKKESFDLIFSRPREPVFLTKGARKAKFNVPDKFLTSRYKDVGTDLNDQLHMVGSEQLDVQDINELPNLDFAYKIDRYDMFSLYVPSHRNIASELTELFMKCANIDELESLSVYCRDRLNPMLFNYSLSIALMHRSDTQDYLIPTFMEVFPDKFIDGAIYQQARAEVTIVPDGDRMPVTLPINASATNINDEQKVAYFREDLGLNLMYHTWNLIYPFDAKNIDMVNKSRRGELFYYLHQQILARYNCERMSNKLYRVERLNNLREPISEGYFPKINSQTSGKTWSPRFNNTTLQDINRPKDLLRFDVAHLERWINRIIDSIDIGFATANDGTRIFLNDNSGIDCLANMIQSSALSPNQNYYGDVNSMGHTLIAYSHDPDYRHLESFGVMGEPATAMRDPIFYRWHAYLLDIFQMHKNHLPPYTMEELGCSNIVIENVEIQFQSKINGTSTNLLQTYMAHTDYDMSRGMDFVPLGSIYVRMGHMQHYPFRYKIKIKNSGSTSKMGTIRLFMAPKCDERRRLLTFDDQRVLMIELDRFITQVREGTNYIIRRSEESSVTIPYEQTFSPEINRMKALEDGKMSYCGCGWPQHMLIPKGDADGMDFDLFAMMSDFRHDRIEHMTGSDGCTKTYSYCGIFDSDYPDARPMGFPFDRPCSEDKIYLSDFLTPNMYVQTITIQSVNHDNDSDYYDSKRSIDKDRNKRTNDKDEKQTKEMEKENKLNKN